MNRALFIALLAATTFVACDEKKPAGPATTTPSASVSTQTAPSATVTAAATAAPTASAIADNTPLPTDLATEEDFWDEAEKELTKDNMEAELGKIEKELAATK